MVIVFMAIATGCIVVYITNSFRGTVYRDNTHLFAVDLNDCPDTIEKEYSLSVVPEGYKLYEVVSDEEIVYIVYRNADSEELIFIQTVKSKFNSHINTENNTIGRIVLTAVMQYPLNLILAIIFPLLLSGIVEITF